MRDSQKTRNQLLNELQETRQQLEMLAAAEVERKKVGDELSKSEEKFYKAFLASPDMIIITSIPDGRYIEVNESFAEVTGYTREELIGHTAAEFNLWVDTEDLQKMIRILGENGRIKNEEYRFRTKSGDIRNWLCSGDVINIDGDTCMIAVAVDITESKKMEKALRESEEKFSKAFRVSPQMISISRIEDRKYLDVNDSFVKTTGYTREELVGHSVDEISMWVKPEEQQEMAHLVLEQGYIKNKEYSFRTKSGEIRLWLCSSDTISINGKLCSIAVATDITERTQMEKNLRESEEKFAKAFRSSPESITITRLSDGVYMEVNDSFTRVFGFTREETIGRKSSELNVWAQPIDRELMVQRIIKQHRISNEEYQFRTKSGEIRTVLFSAEAIECEGERCVLSVANDITDYKKMEAKALEAESLREVDKLRTELLANVSHELRTPLASIKGFTTMLIDYDRKLTNQEKQEYLDTINKNSDRLVELIEQLLEMSRLGVGMSPIMKMSANVAHLCQDVVAQARMRAPDHVFVLDLPSRLPQINIDDRRIRQVLDNLMDNAVKYSDPGVEIGLSVRKDTTEMLFTVTDHGSGISKNDLPHVFERAFRSSRGQKSGVQGAGLGLPICKALIEAHGGRIWIESEEGVGTRCFFTLPLKTGQSTEKNKQQGK
jgi:PAS domain S-box-containing protein